MARFMMWSAHAGQALADLARRGRLRRDLRAVLAHHMIFHANRAGITATDLSTLARCALSTVFTADPIPSLPVPPNGAADFADSLASAARSE